MKIKLLIIALLVCGFTFGQVSYLGLDGGLEGSATIDNVGTAGPAAGKWTKNNATQTISNETTTVRSGNNSLKVNNSTTTGRRVWSPNFVITSTTSQVTVQYYKRVVSITNTQEDQPGIINNAEGISGAYNAFNSVANTWVKVTYTKTSSTFTTLSGLFLHRAIGTGGDMIIDDMCVYTGGVDVIAPNNATAASTASPTTSTLNISWTSASGGVDGGGYIVVRGTSDPTTAPNVNGIYAVGNTIAAGMTVVYRGTGTSFTDGSLTSGTQYFYRVYTYDKAYNYAATPSNCNGTTTTGAITSSATGNWSNTATWDGGVVPTSADNAIIASGHTVTMDSGTYSTRNSGTTTTVNAGGTLATTLTYTNNGTTTVNGTFQIGNGGYANGTNPFVYGASGSTLIMNHNTGSSYSINAPQTFWPITSPPYNVTLASNSPAQIDSTVGSVAGTATLNSQLIINSANLFTVNGTLQLNANGFVGAGNAPVYGTASLLRYNSGGTFNRGSEWTGASSGAGFPNNVQISNSGTSLNMGGAGTAYCGGYLLIDSSTTLNTDTTILNVKGDVTTNGTLNLGADIKLGGNWTVGTSGSQNNNSKAVFFNGASGNQTIAKTGNGIVYFDYLILDKTAGSTVLSSSPSTDITINSTSGDVLQLLNAGALDLNGRTLTLNNNGGNISTNASGRTITSSVAGGTIAVTGTKSIVGTGTLILNTNVTTVLTNGLNFGSSKTIVNGTLQLNSGGFAETNPPIYGNASLLRYNDGGTFGRGLEWIYNGVGTIGTTPGYPNNVQLSNNTTLNYNNGTPLNKAIAGNLTIDSGSSFYMDYGGGASGGVLTVAGNVVNNGTFKLGSAVGDDLIVSGSWTNTGTFSPNSRLVTFNGSSAQTITGATTFDYLTINNTANVTLASPVTNNFTLNFANGKLILASNNVTIGSGGSIANATAAKYLVTNGSGKLIRQGVGNTPTDFPIGFSPTNYTPITLTNTTGTSNLSVSVKQSISNPVTDATKIVTLEWGIASSAATTATISPNWVAATPINQAASFTNIGTGELANYTTAYTTYPVTLSTTTTTATGVSLQSGSNVIVVGNTGDVYTAPPFNDLCSSSIDLTANVSATTGNLKGSIPTVGLTYGATKKDVWYSFTPNCTGFHTITVTGFTGDVDMDVFTSSCPTSGVGTYTSHGSSGTETISATLTSGLTYYIRVLAWNTTAENSAFTIQVTNNGGLTLTNTGSPAAGNISANTNNVVLFGFDVTPNACTTKYDFTQVIISKTGTTTSSDLSNFRIFYDANGDGAISGDSSVSGAGIAMTSSMSFTITGQTNLTLAREYLLVADVDVLATGGNTFRATISPSTNLSAILTPTGTVTGTATGNTQTIIYNGPEINVTRATAASIPTGSVASLGYDTVFAGTAVGSSTTAKTYRIYNLGSTTLNVSAVSSDNTEFVVNALASYAIAPGTFVSFTITFSPLNIGTRTAVISIINNDITNDGALTENPYVFNVEGTGNCPSSTNTITPTSGPEGTIVTITSSNSTTNNLTGATVAINGVTALVNEIAPDKITIIIPNGATSGSLMVTNAIGCTVSNAFTVIDNISNGCDGSNFASDLFISEVTDSNYGGLGYIEIYNGTGVTKNLGGYSLRVAANGNLSGYNSTLTLNSTSLPSGSTYVVATGVDGSNLFCPVTGGNGLLANQTTSGLGINFKPDENDHIALFNGSTKIDSWGIPFDKNWATNTLTIGTSGADFRRKNTATLPNTTYNNSDWVIIDFAGTGSANCANNDYSNVGIYNFATGTPPSVTLEPSYTSTCKGTSLTVAGSEGYNGTSPADTKELAYQWFENVPPATGWTALTDNTIYSGTTEPQLIISNISTLINNQYYCQIRENSNTCYTATIAVQITPVGIITWNGTDWRDLNNIITIPTLDNLVIIDADYDTATDGNLNACSLIINPNKTLTISATNPPFIGEFVNVKSDLTINGDLVIENNGSLVQIDDDAINTGEISITRIAQASKYDYIYWSSPVEDFPIASVPNSHRYEWDATAPNPKGTEGNWLDASGNMQKGKGYIVRASNGETTPKDLSVTFTGIPFNGIADVSISRGSTIGTDDCWNLVGNPYPSAIDADLFLAQNKNIEGSVRIWTHGKSPDTNYGNPFYQDFTYNYDEDDYITYNGTATTIPDVFNGKIASGQGFFIRMLEDGETDVLPPASTTIDANSTITFKNAYRRATNGNIFDNSNFFRPSTARPYIEKSRIWLDLIASNNQITKTVIGYVPGATLAKDRLYDALIEVESFKLYSLINTQKQAIQGRPLPFDSNDLVPMGMFIEKAGNYIIAISAVDGLFSDPSQSIYIEDKTLNIIHDLRRTPYQFISEKGMFNERFVLRYTNASLGVSDFETFENNIVIASDNEAIKIRSSHENIQEVDIYDMLGRKILNQNKVNNKELTINNRNLSKQTYIVKIKLENNQIVSRKIVF